MQPSNFVKTKTNTFVLADGISPFHVLATIELSIRFANQITKIQAKVAQNLCTDIIVGMDYITFYNLQIDTKQKLVSIELNGRRYYMKKKQNDSLQLVPITLAHLLRLPPMIHRSAAVTSSMTKFTSMFIPNLHFVQNNSLHIPHKFLQFHDHISIMTISNISSYPQSFNKGACIGFLCSFVTQSFNRDISTSTSNPESAAKYVGKIPVSCDLVVDHSYHTPLTHFLKTPLNDNKLPNQSIANPNTQDKTYTLHPTVEKDIRQLASMIKCQPQHDTLLSLLLRYHQIFNTNKHNIADTPIHHVIKTISHTPPACKPYPQPDKEVMYNIIQEFLQAGLIAESHSPYATPAILVKKKDGQYRFVVDYKKWNLITIKDSSPLPNMEETIRKLGQGHKYFSKLDLKSRFYQIPINQEDKEKTAFVTSFGLYQFNVLPMGLVNSPPTFQKVMSNTLKSCRQFCFVYLNDIIVFSKTYEDHINHLEQVFFALLTKRFVLNPPKYQILMPTINYLGHTITEKTVTPLSEKIQAIVDIKEPHTLAQANKFIGALSWYRKFLPNFATVAAPIHAVTNLNKKDRRKFKWSMEQSVAFYRLKQMLVTAPLFLHFPVDNQPLILTTDASNIGIGGVLQQEIDGQLRNLYYHSQLMTPCERQYSPIEKEALAIYRCFTRMRPYMLGRRIIVKTDHCPLCNIMKKTIRNARVDRIAQLIQEYNIEQVVHINGRDNCLADYLSRYPRDQNDDLYEIDYGIGSKEVILDSTPADQLPLSAMILRPRSLQQQSIKASTASDPFHHANRDSVNDADTDTSTNPLIPSNYSANYFDTSQLKEGQDRDPDIQNIIRRLHHKLNSLPFILKDNLLRRLISPFPHSKTKSNVIYLPSSMIESLLYACHNDPMTGGHFSLDRTYNKIKNLYWWPKMKLGDSMETQPLFGKVFYFNFYSYQTADQI